MIYTGRKIAYIPGDSILVRQPAAAAWTPVNITGLQAWYDFSDITTLFVDAGTTPVSADGDLIYQVNDKSTNNRHAVQATAGVRPEYKTNVKNSLSAALGDASRRLTCVTTIAYSAFTVFCVANTGTAQDKTMLDCGPTGNVPYIQLWVYDATIQFQFRSRNDSLTLKNADSGINVGNAWKIYQAAYNGTTQYTNVNGVDGATVGQTGTVTPTRINIMGNSNLYGWNSHIGEILIYNSDLSAGDKTTIRAYLNAKWAVY